jgi:hypothetical protein
MQDFSDRLLEAREAMNLPANVGNTLRGGFGNTFRKLVCLERKAQTCDGCLLKTRCPYAYIFDPSPPPGAEVLSTQSDVPLAFVLEPPLDGRREYATGEKLEFGLTLVGNGIQYLPYFVAVFRELGKQGLGRDRARYTLASVTAVHPVDGRHMTVYSARDEVLHDHDFSATWDELAAQAASRPGDHLTIDFLTPTRLKHGGHFVDAPDFHVLIRALLRRTSSLAYFHGGERWETDYRGWIERAEQVRTVSAQTVRQSSRGPVRRGSRQAWRPSGRCWRWGSGSTWARPVCLATA